MGVNTEKSIEALRNSGGIQAVLLELWNEFNPHVEREERPPQREGLSFLDERQILKQCMDHDRDGKFHAVYEGNWEGLFPSHSDADIYLCGRVAFWSDRDPKMMDSIFRSSGLMRIKWNRADYRERTMDRAINGCTVSFSEWKEQQEQERRRRIAALWQTI